MARLRGSSEYVTMGETAIGRVCDLSDSIWNRIVAPCRSVASFLPPREVMGRRQSGITPMHRWGGWIAAVTLVLSAVGAIGLARPQVSLAQEKEYSEYEVKATLMLKLLRFSSWPDIDSLPEGSPLYIGVLGQDPFKSTLDDVVKNKELRGHPLRVLRSESIDELTECQVLFIAGSEEATLPGILEQLDRRPILTVGDQRGFARRGVMVNLVLKNNKVSFEINYGAIRKSELDLDAQVLKLATLVETEGADGESSPAPAS